ncbi:hypothetical protein K402DRAFT_78847 [Aulographum hederae CBS 113979]|uniref:C2H2-type domain-containing protein n=1 Tax=Aulographum hederae CBS 113979 TaxID=1176131 RepID=A0A6G1HG79_9PEZI|nr:hypothetical protein K402DRAFT_78847 [Aulographum hederae CBS 113979]
MSASHTHPRRSDRKAPSPLLYKSPTFTSSPRLADTLCHPVHTVMPKRSVTSSQALEDLVVDAREDRISKFLAGFDKAFSGGCRFTDENILADQEVFPVPDFMVARAAVEEPMDIDIKPLIADHHHASDSGIGSSISDSHNGRRLNSSARSVTSTFSGVNRSASTLSSINKTPFSLSTSAEKRIRETILLPILKEKSLQEFHPLIKDIPRRIGAKDITNLRDLEKTLIFLAPVSANRITLAFNGAVAYPFRNVKEFAASHIAYLAFCERSIELIVNTVDYLTERDQHLPTERPYTNYYFLDLVEQIRRYAEIMARTREKEAAGEELDDNDFSPYVPPTPTPTPTPFDHHYLHSYSSEEIVIQDGLSHNGKPVQLVRKKDGKEIPIAEEGELPATSISKRALSEDTDDDGVRRSMARRRKSERPGDVIHSCNDCGKEFKRPCDLTKHEKTHSRPWKCSDAKCKYHDLGWPTEKERDRHMNDKHSAAPPMHKCEFAPCTYSSKRESNCKQHMEKAHGWTYVRSKHNGRNKRTTATSSNAASTPLTPFMATPASTSNHLATPATPFAPSPSVAAFDIGQYNYSPAQATHTYTYDNQRRESVNTAGSAMTYSTEYSPYQGSTFNDVMTPEESEFEQQMNYTFESAGNYTMQQPTPALSTSNAFINQQVPQLSPHAQADAMLFSPEDDMPMDETFGGTESFQPNGDFTLYDHIPAPQGSLFDNNAMFPADTNAFDFGNYGANTGLSIDDLFDDLNPGNNGNAM